MLFPGSYQQLVRVYNHLEVDQLLVSHDAAAAARDRCATSAAAARALLKAGEGNDGGTTPSGWRLRLAAKQLGWAEAGEAKWGERAALLEAQVAEARAAALAHPLGTAFIALFRSGWRGIAAEAAGELGGCGVP